MNYKVHGRSPAEKANRLSLNAPNMSCPFLVLIHCRYLLTLETIDPQGFYKGTQYLHSQHRRCLPIQFPSELPSYRLDLYLNLH